MLMMVVVKPNHIQYARHINQSLISRIKGMILKDSSVVGSAMNVKRMTEQRFLHRPRYTKALSYKVFLSHL